MWGTFKKRLLIWWENLGHRYGFFMLFLALTLNEFDFWQWWGWAICAGLILVSTIPFRKLTAKAMFAAAASDLVRMIDVAIGLPTQIDFQITAIRRVDDFCSKYDIPCPLIDDNDIWKTARSWNVFLGYLKKTAVTCDIKACQEVLGQVTSEIENSPVTVREIEARA